MTPVKRGVTKSVIMRCKMPPEMSGT